MRDFFYTVLVAGVVTTTLAVVNLTVRLDKAAITAEQAYKKGYADGKQESTISVPKACVKWWFGEGEVKLRHDQAVRAYCKGSK